MILVSLLLHMPERQGSREVLLDLVLPPRQAVCFPLQSFVLYLAEDQKLEQEL